MSVPDEAGCRDLVFHIPGIVSVFFSPPQLVCFEVLQESDDYVRPGTDSAVVRRLMRVSPHINNVVDLVKDDSDVPGAHAKFVTICCASSACSFHSLRSTCLIVCKHLIVEHRNVCPVHIMSGCVPTRIRRCR